jgi:hypothetical protein
MRTVLVTPTQANCYQYGYAVLFYFRQIVDFSSKYLQSHVSNMDGIIGRASHLKDFGSVPRETHVGTETKQ